jgi:hypothetical protein
MKKICLVLFVQLFVQVVNAQIPFTDSYGLQINDPRSTGVINLNNYTSAATVLGFVPPNNGSTHSGNVCNGWVSNYASLNAYIEYANSCQTFYEISASQLYLNYPFEPSTNYTISYNSNYSYFGEIAYYDFSFDFSIWCNSQLVTETYLNGAYGNISGCPNFQHAGLTASCSTVGSFSGSFVTSSTLTDEISIIVAPYSSFQGGLPYQNSVLGGTQAIDCGDAAGDPYWGLTYTVNNLTISRTCNGALYPDRLLYQATTTLPSLSLGVTEILAGNSVNPAATSGNVSLANGKKATFESAQRIILSPGFVANIQNCSSGGGREESPLISSSNISRVNNPAPTIYPNPIFSGSGNLNFSKRVNSYQIFNSSGALVKSGEQTNQANIDGLSPGIYLIKLDEAKTKFIVQ